MNDLVPVAAELAAGLFPEWLRDTVRIATVRMPDRDTVRFRIDPGRAFERSAELVRQPGYGGRVFNLTVRQRYLPYEDPQFVLSANVHLDTVAEALWRALNHANLLVPVEYWRSGAGYTTRKPLWAIETDARQPDAIKTMEALAAARAGETGTPHYLSRRGHQMWCNVNAPHRGEFYSVNPASEWSLHYHPVTYPLDDPPSELPDRVGTHPVVLAHLRNMAEPTGARRNTSPVTGLPLVTSPGKAPLPREAWPPEQFIVPFRAKGDKFNPLPEPTKEIPMPEPAAIPAPANDPWEGAHAEVQLVDDAARFAKAAGLAQTGFVVGFSDFSPDADRVCTVHFPGAAGNVTLPDDLLAPAAPFPAVTTSHGEIASIETAEALLIDSAARVRFQLEQGGKPDPEPDRDRRQLARALGNMCGLDPNDLVRQLDPMIGKQVAAYGKARGRRSAGATRPAKKASAVAAADIPKVLAPQAQLDTGQEPDRLKERPTSAKTRARA